MRADTVGVKKRTPAARSYAETAYASVRKSIVRCALPPGMRTTEAELAAQFGSSKTPLREACQRLVREGLLIVEPRQGYVVAPVTLRDVREIFDLRRALEPAAAVLASQKIAPEALARLGRLAKTGYERGNAHSFDEFIRVNNELHLAIADAADNARLRQAIEHLLAESERIIRFGMLIDPHSAEAADEHGRLIKALLRRDVDGARDAMIEHLKTSEDMALASLMMSPTLREVPLQISEGAR